MLDTQTEPDQMPEAARQETLETGRLKMLKHIHTWWRSLTSWSTMGDEVHSGPGVCSNDLCVVMVPSSASLMGEKVVASICCGSVRARLLKAVSMRSAQANVHSEDVTRTCIRRCHGAHATHIKSVAWNWYQTHLNSGIAARQEMLSCVRKFWVYANACALTQKEDWPAPALGDVLVAWSDLPSPPDSCLNVCADQKSLRSMCCTHWYYSRAAVRCKSRHTATRNNLERLISCQHYISTYMEYRHIRQSLSESQLIVFQPSARCIPPQSSLLESLLPLLPFLRPKLHPRCPLSGHKI